MEPLNLLNDRRDTQAVGEALEENFRAKVTCFPAQHAQMRVAVLGDVTCVDTGVASDTFNCAVGGAFQGEQGDQFALQASTTSPPTRPFGGVATAR